MEPERPTRSTGAVTTARGSRRRGDRSVTEDRLRERLAWQFPELSREQIEDAVVGRPLPMPPASKPATVNIGRKHQVDRPGDTAGQRHRA